jgi:hypothetical protein
VADSRSETILLHNQFVGILLVATAATVHGLTGGQPTGVPATPTAAANARNQDIPFSGRAKTGRGNVRPALESITGPEHLILF